MSVSRNIPWHRTIRTKLIAVIVLTTSVVLGIAGYFSYKYIEQQQQSELTELAEVSASRLSKHLVIPMWNLDREQVGELLSAEMQESRVAAIVILDEDGRTLFAAKDRDVNGDVIESTGKISGDYINVDKKVVKGDEEIGLVSMYITSEYMDGELKTFGNGVISVVVILNLAIFIIMMLVLGKLLINPLMALATGAEKISRGDLSQNFEVSARDEIGYLATTFNKMQSSLKVAIRRLTKSGGK